LHNLKYIESNKILTNNTFKYTYIHDNTLKFKKNEEVGVIINAKMYGKNVLKYLKVKIRYNKI